MEQVFFSLIEKRMQSRRRAVFEERIMKMRW
jgi:hypothetical protein